MNSLKNKIIVVTGGCGLIGSSIIDDLKKNNAITVNLDITHSDDFESGRINCDITNSVSVKSSIDKILKKYKRIDGWVNNAYPRTEDWNNKLENVSLKSWKKNVDMQLNSLFDCSKKVLEVMSKQNYGSLVNISSIYGIVGPDFSIYKNTEMTMPAAYSAVKGGIINFTKYLASYYGPKNIRVNCISPGGVFNNQNSIFVENYIKKVPLSRMASNKEISPAVCFLLSNDSSYITGHNLVIDGGVTIV